MTKNELRRLYKEKRTALTDADKMRLEDLMLIQFQQSEIDIPSVIMTYSPIEKHKEFNAQLITDYCYFKNPGQLLLYPVVNEAEGGMESILVTDDTVFATNRFGVDEPVTGENIFPEEIDLVLVPLLCFDKLGCRVGYGKGYYDRFLVECRDDVVKVGFSFFEPVSRIADAGLHDVRLDYCVTPYDVYRF